MFDTGLQEGWRPLIFVSSLQPRRFFPSTSFLIFGFILWSTFYPMVYLLVVPAACTVAKTLGSAG